jgi:hypothetical protein
MPHLDDFPMSSEEFKQLKKTVLLSEDFRYLRLVGEVLRDQIDDVVSSETKIWAMNWESHRALKKSFPLQQDCADSEEIRAPGVIRFYHRRP